MIPHGIESSITSLASGSFQTLCVRGSPFLVNALLSRHASSSTGRRLIVSTGIVFGLGAATMMLDLNVFWALGYAYYAAVGVMVHYLVSKHGFVFAEERLTPVIVFFMLLVVFPACVCGQYAAATFLFIGWDLSLKCHSYAVDYRRVARINTEARSLRTCLFFLFVDPSLVFAERGRPRANAILDKHACWRFVSGLAALTVGLGLVEVARYFTLKLNASNWHWPFVLIPIVLMLAEYGKHSGVASVQVSLMRASGYHVPERYERPYLAKSPIDFWRRWNTYVGRWINLYVYTPFATSLARAARAETSGHITSRFRRGCSVLVAFASAGILHDVYACCAGRPGFRSSVLLLANGVLVCCWGFLQSRARQISPSRHEYLTRRLSQVSHAMFIVAFVAVFGVWVES